MFFTVFSFALTILTHLVCFYFRSNIALSINLKIPGVARSTPVPFFKGFTKRVNSFTDSIFKVGSVGTSQANTIIIPLSTQRIVISIFINAVVIFHIFNDTFVILDLEARVASLANQGLDIEFLAIWVNHFASSVFVEVRSLTAFLAVAV